MLTTSTTTTAAAQSPSLSSVSSTSQEKLSKTLVTAEKKGTEDAPSDAMPTDKVKSRQPSKSADSSGDVQTTPEPEECHRTVLPEDKDTRAAAENIRSDSDICVETAGRKGSESAKGVRTGQEHQSFDSLLITVSDTLVSSSEDGPDWADSGSQVQETESEALSSGSVSVVTPSSIRPHSDVQECLVNHPCDSEGSLKVMTHVQQHSGTGTLDIVSLDTHITKDTLNITSHDPVISTSIDNTARCECEDNEIREMLSDSADAQSSIVQTAQFSDSRTPVIQIREQTPDMPETKEEIHSDETGVTSVTCSGGMNSTIHTPSQSLSLERETSAENKKLDHDESTNVDLQQEESIQNAVGDDVSRQRTQKDNGQSVVAKWKRLVKTSRVANLRETLTSKLTTPVVRAESVSPPPPVSPSPPRKYSWSREGGIWKKVYTSSFADDADHVIENDDARPSEETPIDEGSASHQPDQNKKEDGEREDRETREEDTTDQEKAATIDFPSVFAMSKKFEQESTRRTQDRGPKELRAKTHGEEPEQDNSFHAKPPSVSPIGFATTGATERNSSDKTGKLTGEQTQSVFREILADRSSQDNTDSAAGDLLPDGDMRVLHDDLSHSVPTSSYPPALSYPAGTPCGRRVETLTTGSALAKRGTQLFRPIRELSKQGICQPDTPTVSVRHSTVRASADTGPDTPTVRETDTS